MTCLHSGFLRHTALSPQGIALVIGARSYTYAELFETAARWAARLREAGKGHVARVGVFAYRNETSYVGVLASLFAGAAFVPLNRKFPIERTRSMIAQANLDVLIVDAESLPQVHEVTRGLRRCPLLVLPTVAHSSHVHRFEGQVVDKFALALPTTTPPARATPEQLAYLLFTSGSTGVPSGVPVTHGNVRAFLDVNTRRYRLGPTDRLTQCFDQTFDLSVFDLFMAWDNGAAVCAMQPIEMLAPFNFLRNNGISVWFSVPSAAALLMKRGALVAGQMPDLRWSLFCGEGLPRSVAEAWQRAAPNSTLENLYGPTELTIACAAYRWDPQRSPSACVNELVPIGELYPGLASMIVDASLKPVAEGESGELCVAGPQTSPGYWNDAEKTAARFFQRAGAMGEPQWFHRTGDLVARRSGQLVYLGRCGTQIKIGGHRIELGEVEGSLRKHGAVEAIAVPMPSEEHPDHIVAVVAGTPSVPKLQMGLRQQLPNYMLPREIHTIREVPLNANGKADRKAVRAWLEAQLPRQMAG